MDWTEDEDFYLSQGYAIYHDEKTDIWQKILKLFPFKPSRVASDLQERWRVLTDQLEIEDQGSLERIKDAPKFGQQTWAYKYEPTIQTPDPNQVIEQFKSLPSLAMKTQSIELHSSRFTNENQNINEMCLNYQFEASSIRSIVQNVLKKTVDDETLRTTLMEGFKVDLSRKGREFAYEDIERKLKIINEMEDAQEAEKEVLILLEYFDKIFLGMSNRLKSAKSQASTKPNILPNVLNDIFGILKSLRQRVKPPLNAKPILDQFFIEFTKRYFQAFGNIFNFYIDIQQTNLFRTLYYQIMEYLIKEDTSHEIDQYLQNLQQNNYYKKLREKIENKM